MLHLLYISSRGGGFFIVWFPEGRFWGATPELRYARIDLDRIVAQSADAHEQTASAGQGPSQWVHIEGTTLFPPPHPQGPALPQGGTEFFERGIRPLNRFFVVNMADGHLTGLISASIPPLISGETELRIPGGGYWVEFRIDNAHWLPGYTFVTAEDLPLPRYEWRERTSEEAVIRGDTHGNLHALLQHRHAGDGFMNYVKKSGNEWSAPLTLGRSDRGSFMIAPRPRTLTVNDTGDVFAAWVDEENKFVGRWIRRRNSPGSRTPSPRR
jgi:hypothetical protein